MKLEEDQTSIMEMEIFVHCNVMTIGQENLWIEPLITLVD